MKAQRTTFFEAHPGTVDLRAEVVAGFSSNPRAIPPKFFYDERGSELFDLICDQPEYYQTRTEMHILQQSVQEIVERIGEQCVLVELGSGASKKVRLLLEALKPSGYVGVDISREFLLSSTERLARDYPWLEVHAACVDFSQGLEIPYCNDKLHKVAFFPGSSIGNFEPFDARRLLRDIGELVGDRGHLLIGVDLKKDVDLLHAAYNDAAGVTAQFNLNLIHRIRAELECDIDPDSFSHYAFYNPLLGRIEMHLISKFRQRVQLENKPFLFERGTGIHTENSYKYSVEEFAELAAEVGFHQREVWNDEAELFSVQLFEFGPQA